MMCGWIEDMCELSNPMMCQNPFLSSLSQTHLSHLLLLLLFLSSTQGRKVIMEAAKVNERSLQLKREKVQIKDKWEI